MLFPTPAFAVFFTIVFAAAWALRSQERGRKALLLTASYFFYGWWDWRFCFLLLAASLIAWLAGLYIPRVRTERERRHVVALAVILLLGVLAFFKYYGFFVASLQDLLFAAGLQRDLPLLAIVLPVGISFFTFQAISYVVDVYRGEVEARTDPLDLLLYVSFFPQLVAGPIVRAADFLPQLERPAILTRGAVTFGFVLIASGLFKKMVIANYLATELVDPVFLDPASFSGAVLLASIYGYAVQIYCDFSGYSDIAIGTAALLGYRFMENFNQPYRATSLQDFWRRWHISLSSWLRDYLYIPLGGSRGGTLATYRNLILTMFLGGLWHGAAWTFIIWGMLHGCWLALERALLPHRTGEWRSTVGAVLGWVVTFHVVCAAWVFFRAGELQIALEWFYALAAFAPGFGDLTWFILFWIALAMVFQFTPPALDIALGERLARWPLAVSGALFILAVAATLWLSPPGTAPFIYFQF